MRALWLHWPRSLILLIWTKTKSRSVEKKKKREKGPDFYPTILSERASSIKDLLQSRRNIAVSGIKNWYFVRCERTPSVFVALFSLRGISAGNPERVRWAHFARRDFLRNQYTGFPSILLTVTTSEPINRCMLFLSHGALELV